MADAIPPMEKLVKIYIKLRDEIKRVTDERDTEINKLKEKQDTVAQAMLDMLKETGAESIRTPFGTVWKTIKTRYYVNDWSEFNKFVLEHEAVDLYEKRIHQTNMTEFLKNNPGVIPPTLNSDSKYDVSVRKANAK
jgi:hypothetical protein